MKIHRSFPWLHLAILLCLLTATLLASRVADRRTSTFLAQPLDTVPWTISGFSGSPNPPLSDAVLGKLLPTTYLTRTYRKEALQADLFIAFYARQRAGESMHSPKHCMPGAGWEIWQHGSAPVAALGRRIDINQYSINNSGTRMLMFYWYQSRERIIANEYLGKFLLVQDTILTGDTSGSIVRVMLPDVPAAREQGIAFSSELIPHVQRCFSR